MGFESAIEELALKVEEYGPTLGTEEATKTALVMPFIAKVLGYDVFDPAEVIPEFTADLGTKKGEKIDYAIARDGQVQMLIECKHVGGSLDVKHASQLFRYFHTSNARVGVLTNGQLWHFFTDLDRPNRMDERPFLRLDLSDIDPYVLPELKKLTKSAFDIDSVLSAAEELKYVSGLKKALGELFADPSDEFVRLLATQIYDRPFTAKAREFFGTLTVKACRQWLNDQVNDRLKSALGGGAPAIPPASGGSEPEATEAFASEEEFSDGVETTIDEMEGFHIIRAIAVQNLPVSRINHRDTKSYFGILVDDNNRKPLARLHFNRRQKYLGLFDDNKIEERVPLASVVDIYDYAERIRETAARYIDS